MKTLIILEVAWTLRYFLWMFVLTGTFFALGWYLFFTNRRQSKNNESAVLQKKAIEPIVDDTNCSGLNLLDSYRQDPSDKHAFLHCKYAKFKIRVVYYKKRPDEADFSMSFRHDFEERDSRILLARVPQLEDVEYDVLEHSILLTKSPAVSWEELQDTILKVLFLHMYKKYVWRFEKQKVIINVAPESDSRLIFSFRTETKNFLDLGIALLSLPGIKGDYLFPKGMDNDNIYEFSLSKVESFSWDELLPQVCKLIGEHFEAGVEYHGYQATNVK